MFMFKFQMQVTGRERKEIARMIAEHFGTKAAYRGAPGFEYAVTDDSGRELLIDKAGTIIIHVGADDNAAKMFAGLTVLDENGLAALGQAEITISTEGHSGVTLRNLVNILAAKQKLITKTMGIAGKTSFINPAAVEVINAAPLKTIDDFLKAAVILGDNEESGLRITNETINFCWFAPSLNPETIQAYIQFAGAVNRAALAQKRSSTRESITENERYRFRCWLLHLGFIGDQFRTSRKVLLEGLEGNGSFRTKEQASSAALKRKKQLA
jgi:hypothetical protein